MHKTITLKDIALRLNLSISSVSKALRDCPDIGDKTRQRVHQYAKKIDYQCNPMGANLRTKRTNLIGIIVPDITDLFDAHVVSGATSVISKGRYNVLIRQSKGDNVQETQIMRELANGWVDGLIVLTPFPDRNAARLKIAGRNVPSIMLTTNPNNFFKSDKVCDNDIAFSATEMLVRSGYRKICCMSLTQSRSELRLFANGFKAALTHYRISYEQNLVKLVPQRVDQLTQRALIDEIENTVAASVAWIFIGKQTIKFIIKHLSDFKIDSDVKIHFLSDSLLCIYREKRADEFAQKYELGRAAAYNLIKKIENKLAKLSRQ